MAEVIEDPGCTSSPVWTAFRETLMQLSWDDNAVFAHQQSADAETSMDNNVLALGTGPLISSVLLRPLKLHDVN